MYLAEHLPPGALKLLGPLSGDENPSADIARWSEKAIDSLYKCMNQTAKHI
ncbi:hypothetical protein PI124_g16183 [Phytophthora idaei]|nr:hypothetical protein PI125_g16468 [Phytophthora idaei]KAG3141694.1 hypothetical protein PI126_g15375 [Phytophthora idaei]KAG3238867.1 hypothetical protein PI124_g16183 [Phytophthora idaei]